MTRHPSITCWVLSVYCIFLCTSSSGEAGASGYPSPFRMESELLNEGDWGIPEKQVFFRSMSSSRPDGRRYEIRIGKGSQVYSIRTPAGELIAPQKPHSAEWVDEVLQTVAVNIDRCDRTHTFLFKEVDGKRVRILQKPEAYFIHQAGTYNRDIEHPGTFYSPMFAFMEREGGRSLATLVWPQQAHIPNNHRSDLLVYQQARWAEPGVVEVSALLYNSGEIELDWFNLPWIGLAKKTLPFKYLIDQNGRWEILDHVWGAGQNIGEFPITQTGGAAVFTTGENSGDEGIALVFGTNDSSSEPYRSRFKQHDGATFLKIGSTINRRELDLQIATVIGQIPVYQHQGLLLRYYVALGNRADVDHAVSVYAKKAYRHPLRPGKMKPATRWIEGIRTEGSTILQETNTPDGIAIHAFPFDSSVPIFLLQNKLTGKYLITSDPYALSEKPYDGNTAYRGLLGFAHTETKSSWNGHVFDRIDLEFATDSHFEFLLGGFLSRVDN